MWENFKRIWLHVDLVTCMSPVNTNQYLFQSLLQKRIHMSSNNSCYNIHELRKIYLRQSKNKMNITQYALIEECFIFQKSRASKWPDKMKESPFLANQAKLSTFVIVCVSFIFFLNCRQQQQIQNRTSMPDMKLKPRQSPSKPPLFRDLF